MPVLHVKRGIEFRPDLYNGNNRGAWLDAVGKELESKGVKVKVGEGANAKEVGNAAELQAAYADLQKAASAAGSTLKGYVGDLVQALDDVVKSTSQVAAGDIFDFSAGSEMAKALGLSDGKNTNYASKTTTDFGKAARTRPEGTMNFAGAMLQAKEAPAVIPGPVVPPPAPGELPESVIAGKKVVTITEVNLAGSAWGRNSSEVEAVRMVMGADKDQMHKLLSHTVDGRTVMQRAQKPTASLAFTVGHPKVSFDQMPWDSDAHAKRMEHPRLWLTVEPDRVAVDPNTGEREVTLGRDQFADHVMEQVDLVTGKFTGKMLDTNHVARVRERKDGTDGSTTRLLFQSKIDANFDEFGVKSAEKQDERVDGSPVNPELVKNAVANFTDGNGIDGGAGCIATKEIVVSMKERGLLPKVQNHGETLAMGVVANKRAPRGRYHLNETSPEALRAHFKTCSNDKLVELVALITASPMAAGAKDALLKEANALLDRSAVVAEATAGLKAIDPNMTVDLAAINKMWPDQQPARDKVEADKREVVANAIFKLSGAFAEKIDEAQRAIGGNEDREVRRAGGSAELRRFFAAQTGNAFGADALKGTTTVGPFLAAFDRELAGANKQAFIDALATSMASAGDPNTRLRDAPDAAAKDKVLGDIRKNLVAEHAEILHRMIEEGGASALGLANDSRRLAYANASRSGWSNFIIDSRDITEGYLPGQFAQLTEVEKASRALLPDASKMMGLWMSADFQVELGYEKPFKDAVRKSKHALLAPLFLDYAQQKAGSGVDLANRATFGAFLQKMAPVPADNDTHEIRAARDAFVADVQAFVTAKMPELKVDLADLIGLVRNADGAAVDSFTNTPEFSKLAPADLASRNKDLAVTSDIYRDIVQMLEDCADSFGVRIVSQLNRASRDLGMNLDLKWEAPKMSKDQMVSALAQGRQV